MTPSGIEPATFRFVAEHLFEVLYIFQVWGTYERGGGEYSVVVGESEGKRPLGRSTLRYEDNIKMDLKEIWWDSVDWAYVAQDRAVVNTVMNLRFL